MQPSVNTSRKPRISVLERLRAIAPMVEFSRRTTAKGSCPVIHTPDGHTPRTLDEMARCIAGEQRVHVNTVWKWYCKYKKYDYFGMAQVRSDCGKSLFFAKHRAIARYLKAMHLQGKAVTVIHRMLRCKFPGKVPHINTLRSYLKSLQRAARRRDTRQKKGARR
jgi:hypothetical protein